MTQEVRIPFVKFYRRAIPHLWEWECRPTSHYEFYAFICGEGLKEYFHTGDANRMTIVVSREAPKAMANVYELKFKQSTRCPQALPALYVRARRWGNTRVTHKIVRTLKAALMWEFGHRCPDDGWYVWCEI